MTRFCTDQGGSQPSGQVERSFPQAQYHLPSSGQQQPTYYSRRASASSSQLGSTRPCPCSSNRCPSDYFERPPKKPETLLLEEDTPIAARLQLPHSSLWVIQPSQEAPSASTRLIEQRQYSDDADVVMINGISKTVRDITLILREAVPNTTGVLRCCGF